MESSHEDIQKTLKLFQTFKRIYEQNPSLLDELLSLAIADRQMPLRPGNFSYILGLITDKQALLITNLAGGQSQIFLQTHLHDQVWTIGRDPNRASLPVRDRRLSRAHAAIRYDPACGFVLYDLRSTNGTYVNGVRIRKCYILQDGDLIRLGSLNFGFFTGSEFRRVGPPLREIQQLLSELAVPPTAPIEEGVVDSEGEDVTKPEEISAVNLERTLHFMNRANLEPD